MEEELEEEADDDIAAPKPKKLQLKSRTITKSGAFTVTPIGEKKKDSSNNPRSKLTSRERRKLERDAKKKKVGTHFYEVVNVKNKSKKKGFLEMAKAFRGHCKKWSTNHFDVFSIHPFIEKYINAGHSFRGVSDSFNF